MLDCPPPNTFCGLLGMPWHWKSLFWISGVRARGSGLKRWHREAELHCSSNDLQIWQRWHELRDTWPVESEREFVRRRRWSPSAVWSSSSWGKTQQGLLIFCYHAVARPLWEGKRGRNNNDQDRRQQWPLQRQWCQQDLKGPIYNLT